MKFRDIITEKQTDVFVLQVLADKDINAKIDGDKVIVDKDDVKAAQKVLKAINCIKKVQGGLNESKKFSSVDDWETAVKKLGYAVKKHPNYAKNATLVAYDGTQAKGSFVYGDAGKPGSGNLNESQELNEEVQASLQTIVDSLINVGNIAQTAHWNLRSRAFVAIHPWFGETYNALFGMADAVAEQIKIANIDLMVNVNRGTTFVAIDEQELFLQVLDALNRVKITLGMAAADSSLSRSLQNLIDGWTSDIEKMIWFIQASTK